MKSGIRFSVRHLIYSLDHDNCMTSQWEYIKQLKKIGSGWLNVGLPNNSYKPITNTAWVRVRLCKLQKRCTRLAAASDKVYQLLAHGRWFSPGNPASSTTKLVAMI